ncbi:MAG: hypothetical protein NXY57DRAFT_1039765 [Lentinula lateritia]|nr:MAG: hypothetical protein NXY57DRAFT_1039765 [Lentinula lateritia]
MFLLLPQILLTSRIHIRNFHHQAHLRVCDWVVRFVTKGTGNEEVSEDKEEVVDLCNCSSRYRLPIIRKMLIHLSLTEYPVLPKSDLSLTYHLALVMKWVPRMFQGEVRLLTFGNVITAQLHKDDVGKKLAFVKIQELLGQRMSRKEALSAVGNLIDRWQTIPDIQTNKTLHLALERKFNANAGLPIVPSSVPESCSALSFG